MGLMPLKPGIENLILGKNFSFPENSFYKEKVFFLKRIKGADRATKVV